MRRKIKSQYIGLLLIFIMFFSTFAFAIISSVYNPDIQPTPTGDGSSDIQVSRSVNRQFTQEEKSYILKNGAVMVEFSKSSDCENCTEYKSIIDDLRKKYNIFLSETESNKTAVQLTGRQTLDVSNITEKALLNAYCDVVFSKPKECVLKDF